VGIDLLRRGLHVFRAIAPNPPQCDLLVMMKGSYWRVEVVSGVRSSSNKLVHNKKPDRALHDVIAVYLAREDRIEYQSVNPEWSLP
jgi:hypothetical protein